MWNGISSNDFLLSPTSCALAYVTYTERWHTAIEVKVGVGLAATMLGISWYVLWQCMEFSVQPPSRPATAPRIE